MIVERSTSRNRVTGGRGTMNKLAKAALVCGFVALLAVPAAALEMRPILTLDVARKILEACIAKAQQQGWKMHVAVLDIGGNLKAFARMDDAQLISEEVAMRKAYCSCAAALDPRDGRARLQQPGAASGRNRFPTARRRNPGRLADHDGRGRAHRRCRGQRLDGTERRGLCPGRPRCRQGRSQVRR